MNSSFYYDSFIFCLMYTLPSMQFYLFQPRNAGMPDEQGKNFNILKKNANSQQHSKRQLQNSSTRFLVVNANSTRSPTPLLCRFEVATLSCLLHTTRCVKRDRRSKTNNRVQYKYRTPFSGALAGAQKWKKPNQQETTPVQPRYMQ